MIVYAYPCSARNRCRCAAYSVSIVSRDDDRVEVRLAAVGLGPQHPAEPLRLLLPRAERAGHLDRHRRLGQVDGEVADLGDAPACDSSPARNASKSRSRSLLVVDALDDRRVQVLAELVQLVDVGADDQHLVALVPLDQGLRTTGSLVRAVAATR